jgi:hypothetical protein
MDPILSIDAPLIGGKNGGIFSEKEAIPHVINRPGIMRKNACSKTC